MFIILYRVERSRVGFIINLCLSEGLKKNKTKPCNLQMERQMSMGSNMMGMQGPPHSSSCSSAHIPSMHSEAKLVSSVHAFTCIHLHSSIIMLTHIHKCTHTHTQAQKCCNLFSTVLCQQSCAFGLCGFHHLVCNQSCV